MPLGRLALLASSLLACTTGGTPSFVPDDTSAPPADSAEETAPPPLPDEVAEEFVGPFPSWDDVRAYGAVGDGLTDDAPAIQRALDTLGTGVGRVLWFPAGTYRIARGLRLAGKTGVAIVGEHPETTSIVWEGGPDGGTMLTLDGTRHSSFGRLAFDGRGKAGVGVDQDWTRTVGNFPTNLAWSDVAFRDLGIGIRAGHSGNGVAETVVARARFAGMREAAFLARNYNVLDWFFWDCLFRDNRVGLSNDPGAGHYHVYDSVFEGSTYADLVLRNASYFGVRRNVSRGSAAFVAGEFTGRNGSPTTIVGNQVVQFAATPTIRVANRGPVLLLDNTFVPGPGATSGVVALLDGYLTMDALTGGNRVPWEGAVSAAGRVVALGDEVVEPAAVPEPDLVAARWRARAERPVFEVDVAGGEASLRAAVDAALLRSGERPVVHLPPGRVELTGTLALPAGADLQLVGDGEDSVVAWAGGATGPVLELAGPSHVTLRDLRIDGGRQVDGVHVVGADTADGRVRFDQGFARANDVGFDLLDLPRTRVELQNGYHDRNTTFGVRATAARVDIWGGASSDNGLSYAVCDGGDVLVTDTWYESGSKPGFVALRGGEGRFTIDGFRSAVAQPGGTYSFDVDGFRGDVAVLGGRLGGRGHVGGAQPLQRVLFAGNQADAANWLDVDATEGTLGVLVNTQYVGESTQAPEQGARDPQFVRELLAPVRDRAPTPLRAWGPEVQDVRVYRVRVENALRGWVVAGGAPRVPAACTREAGAR